MVDLLRLTILGGYLGAGKTTWARHQLHMGRFGPAPHVIVNEAARTSVDDLVLGGGVSLIAGGCACCTALARLITVLRDLCDRRSRGAGPDRVLLETSGLADPAAIARGIAQDPILVRHLRLEATLVVVDALHCAAQLPDVALARRQIASADGLVVTKVAACADPGPLLAMLALLNPTASVEGPNHGAPAPLPPPGPPPILHLTDGPQPAMAEILPGPALPETALRQSLMRFARAP